ncbi:benenodin family lasso peptide [Sphingomonas sp. BIUV-7]|uniref:Benenodin family lasso peptide n=1 Tax=Sphingomonas natans TaxID=3063330 RepID=A0ABT8YCN3_9SPHN|nr:benenodin family lasso peptide [Sphingomonas sp. BIUV-7]MDO6416103.1 benenodin family lasso peptide [Sphingomonas sp. BIUV-7]
MDRDDSIIDLGAASVATKGPVGISKDDALGQNGPGLSDD